MKKLLFCFCALAVSCGSYKSVKDKNLKALNNNLSGKFVAVDHAIDTTKYVSSIQKLFDIKNTDSLVLLKVNANSELEIHFKNGTDQTKFYKGKFQKKYFTIFLERKRIPFAPLFYVMNVNRLKLGIDKKGNLIINKHSDYSAMLFFFGAGHSFNLQYVFQPSKTQ